MSGQSTIAWERTETLGLDPVTLHYGQAAADMAERGVWLGRYLGVDLYVHGQPTQTEQYGALADGGLQGLQQLLHGWRQQHAGHSPVRVYMTHQQANKVMRDALEKSEHISRLRQEKRDG